MSMVTDLWVLPAPHLSKSFTKIDWYLNWQLCKGMAQQRTKAPVELFRILEDCDMSYVEPPHLEVTPLLTQAHGRIPANKCLVLADPVELAPWLQAVHTLASKMHAQSLRIFLPQGADPQTAREIWQSLSPTLNAVEFSKDEEFT